MSSSQPAKSVPTLTTEEDSSIADFDETQFEFIPTPCQSLHSALCSRIDSVSAGLTSIESSVPNLTDRIESLNRKVSTETFRLEQTCERNLDAIWECAIGIDNLEKRVNHEFRDLVDSNEDSKSKIQEVKRSVDKTLALNSIFMKAEMSRRLEKLKLETEKSMKTQNELVEKRLDNLEVKLDSVVKSLENLMTRFDTLETQLTAGNQTEIHPPKRLSISVSTGPLEPRIPVTGRQPTSSDESNYETDDSDSDYSDAEDEFNAPIKSPIAQSNLESSFTLNYKTLTSTPTQLTIPGFYTVRLLKHLIYEHTAVAPKLQVLVFAGWVLRDDQVVADCVKKDGTLILVTKRIRHMGGL
ncbi:hypothetical protein BKA69DRAFT_1126252 [Paraphysoderma sedebokerense]|nr:hypothetical protein BKA69DRAFT_1126252 [Paraphysoderma sedebokerense]